MLGGDSDEDIASAWEAELSGSGSGLYADEVSATEEEALTMGVVPGKGGSERILSQDEIDALLGFSRIEHGEAEGKGIQALLDTSTVSYERLPMLEVVFERLVRLTTTSLRNFTADNVEVSLDSINSTRFGDYLDAIPLPAMMGVFGAKQLENAGLLTVSPPLIYSVIEVLFGGREAMSGLRLEGRPYTSIEYNLVTQMLGIILKDFAIAFEPLSEVEFLLDRVETNPRFAAVSQPGDAAIIVRIRIDMDDRGGYLDIVLPYAMLEPVRELLLQNFMGEKFGNDDIWENHLASQLWRSETEIHVVLDEFNVSLGRMMTLQTGDILKLSVQPDAPALLKCGDIHLTRGRIGHVGQRIALRIDAPVNGEVQRKLEGMH